jgi:hypothetical protein
MPCALSGRLGPDLHEDVLYFKKGYLDRLYVTFYGRMSGEKLRKYLDALLWYMLTQDEEEEVKVKDIYGRKIPELGMPTEKRPSSR